MKFMIKLQNVSEVEVGFRITKKKASTWCEFDGMRNPKDIQIVFCGMTNIDSTKESIIGTSLSSNIAFQNELNFRRIICKLQNFRIMQNVITWEKDYNI